MAGRNSQVSRIYRILNLLEGAPQGLSVNEIWERLLDRDHEIGKRTVYRDLEALSAAGFPLFAQEETTDENAKKWVLEKSVKINHLVLSGRELFALFLARGMLVPLKETPLYADLDQVFGKIEEKLGKTHREYYEQLSSELQFEGGPKWGLGLNAEILDTVRAACAEAQVLSVDYESANSGVKRRRELGPHYLYFAKGSMYLIAEDLEAKEVKVFSIPRMTNAVMEDRPYDGEPINPEKFFESSFGIFHGKGPVKVKLEFSKLVSPYVRERRWHSSQQLVSRPDGKIQLTFDVAITPELVQWVLGFGAEAVALEPTELRSKLSETASKLLAIYR